MHSWLPQDSVIAEPLRPDVLGLISLRSRFKGKGTLDGETAFGCEGETEETGGEMRENRRRRRREIKERRRE